MSDKKRSQQPIPPADDERTLRDQRDNLAMIVRRLYRLAILRGDGEVKVVKQAKEYLSRNNLLGSVIRTMDSDA